MKRIFAVAIILVIILAPGAVASADYGIVVTGHPSDSTCFSGDTAGFYAEARFYNTMDWIFVDPCGGEHSAAGISQHVPLRHGRRRIYILPDSRQSDNGTERLGGFLPFPQ